LLVNAFRLVIRAMIRSNSRSLTVFFATVLKKPLDWGILTYIEKIIHFFIDDVYKYRRYDEGDIF